jgi:NADPH:quinone reductase-like Zn-dependent oxidoreductase
VPIDNHHAATGLICLEQLPPWGQACPKSLSQSVTASFFLVEVTTERLRKIADLIDCGELKTRVGAVLPFARARDAHMILEDQRLRPKARIILNVQAAGEVTATA